MDINRFRWNKRMFRRDYRSVGYNLRLIWDRYEDKHLVYWKFWVG